MPQKTIPHVPPKLRRAASSGLRPRLVARGASPDFAAPALADAAPLVSAILAGTDLALVMVDPQFHLRGFTPAARDLLGLRAADIGRDWRGLQCTLTDPRLAGDMRDVLELQQTREAESTDAGGRSYLRFAQPYRTMRGKVDGVVVTFVDITRRKLIETSLRISEERHRLALDCVAEYAIVLLDLTGRFVSWTASAERILGYTQAEAIGQSLLLIQTPDEQAKGRLARELKQARREKSLTVERWHVRKDGTRFWGTGVLSALHDETGQMYGYVKVLRDNTDRKRSEEALKQAKIDAELTNSAKDSFLANVSHELRTPLAVTLLWAKMLNGGKFVGVRRRREALEAIVKSTEEQQALIEDLMDTSRIVAGKLRLEPTAVKLIPLVQKVLDSVRPAAVDKKLKLQANLDTRVGLVRADGLRLQQVLRNLLTNAVKFTPPGGKIELTLLRAGEQVEIKVADTGQGISPHFIDRVFDRFTQADTAAIRVNGGLGLGLSIARQLVELHGGTITVRSAGLGRGTTFTVRLPQPAVVAPPRTPGRRRHRPPSLAGLRILLIEDTLPTLRALTAVLAHAKAKVIAVVTAAEALKAFNHERPDLVLSDIGLGKIDGHELIRQIRQWERVQKTPPVPAVALTAYADERTRRTALRSGFQQVLTKPVEPFHLITTLAALNDDGQGAIR